MPLRRYILTTLVVACILTVGALASTEFDSDPIARGLLLASAGLFSLAVVRSSLLKPYLVQRRWERYATERGHQCVVGRHGEPRIVGERDGVRFVLAQSTSMLGGGGGYYTRTVVTAAIERGVPDGVRIYRRDALEWMHHLSGLRQIDTGNESLDEQLMIEGTSPQATLSWLAERAAVLEELATRYPRFILFGSEVDGMPASVGGASGALTLIVVGRKSHPEELDGLLIAACRYAREFA